jgi:hypothetical protein
MAMFRQSIVLTSLFAAAFLSAGPCAAAGYGGDYTVSSYSQLFQGPSAAPGSYGSAKEVFVEFSDLSIQPGSSSYSIQMTEASMQRVISEWNESSNGENLIRNAYTNIFSVGQDSGSGNLVPGANNAVIIDGGDITLPFDSTTNVAILLTVDENSADYEEVGMGLIVRKSRNLSDSDVNGTYIRFTIGNENSGATPSGWGNMDTMLMEQSTMVFDGDGNFTEQVEEWASHRVISENEVVVSESDRYFDSYCTVLPPETNSYSSAGTYSVNSADGRVVLNMPELSFTNQVSPDGNLVVAALAQADSESAGCYFSLAIKQPTSFPTNLVDAVFFLSEIEEEFGWSFSTAGNSYNSIETGRTYLFLKSDGTFSMRSDYWNIDNTLDNWRAVQYPNGMVSKNKFTTESEPRGIEFSSGTYSISATGTVMLMFDNGDMGMAQLSENGQYVVYGFVDGEEGYAERVMGFGIRRQAPPAASTPVVFNNDFSMTPAGAVFSASVPTNDVEILYTANLAEGEWRSLMTTNAPDGSLQIHDSAASDTDSRFYYSSFGIW